MTGAALTASKSALLCKPSFCYRDCCCTKEIIRFQHSPYIDLLFFLIIDCILSVIKSICCFCLYRTCLQ